MFILGIYFSYLVCTWGTLNASLNSTIQVPNRPANNQMLISAKTAEGYIRQNGNIISYNR